MACSVERGVIHRAYTLGALLLVPAVIQRGVIVSDELLTTTPVELSSPDFGSLQAQHRQYMSVLEHPEPIAS